MGLCVEGLAGELKTTLSYKENLESEDGNAPLLERSSTECLMWAAAILASSWTVMSRSYMSGNVLSYVFFILRWPRCGYGAVLQNIRSGAEYPWRVRHKYSTLARLTSDWPGSHW